MYKYYLNGIQLSRLYYSWKISYKYKYEYSVVNQRCFKKIVISNDKPTGECK